MAEVDVWEPNNIIFDNSNAVRTTVCFIDLGKLNLFIISLFWSKSVKQTVELYLETIDSSLKIQQLSGRKKQSVKY